MTAYFEQLRSIPTVVAEVLSRVECPPLDRNRPLVFSGIGTSLHAARVAADWIAQLSSGRIRAHAVDAHDVGTGAFPLTSDDQLVVISHRGYKIFPNAALARGKDRGCRTIAIVGIDAPPQQADDTIRTCANETAGTFSVSYLASLAALVRLVSNMFTDESSILAQSLESLPEALTDSLAIVPDPTLVATMAAHAPILLAGSGGDVPTVEEAALKIKEGAWVWTEAMATEFALHGTPASFVPSMSAVMMIPDHDDGGRHATLVEVLRSLGFATVATCGPVGLGANLEFVRPAHPLLRPFTAIIPFHQLTGALAVHLGTDPDTLHGNREPWCTVMKGLKL